MSQDTTETNRTTTADALMGLLSLGPMSGYQIRQLIDERVPRNELLLKLFFGSLVSLDVLVRHVESFRAVQQARLQQYTATAEELNRRHGKHPDLPYWLMTVNYGLHEARALSAWCDETLVQCHELRRRRGLRVVKNAGKERSRT
jgi:hypothetical protein